VLAEAGQVDVLFKTLTPKQGGDLMVEVIIEPAAHCLSGVIHRRRCRRNGSL
jgi:hypothetical protein